MKSIVIICGPTGVGKTGVALELAKRCDGEIVSADSQQVYRGMDIGTAKLTSQEQLHFPYHLIDIVDPDVTFTAAQFVEEADKAIDEITSRRRLPIVVGGTGMYLTMLTNGFCEAPERDAALRERLEQEISTEGLQSLHVRLMELDPPSAQQIHVNDRTRIIRALEIFQLTGMRQSALFECHQFQEKRYRAIKIGIRRDREELYRRINARVDQMMADGWLDEVRELVEQYGVACRSFYALGYRELISHIKGEITFDDATERIKQKSRRFAKRQLTWFRKDNEIQWFSPSEITKIGDAIDAFLSE